MKMEKGFAGEWGVLGRIGVVFQSGVKVRKESLRDAMRGSVR